MAKLVKVLAAWETPNFAEVLKGEILALGVQALPLQRAVTQGGVVGEQDPGITLLRTAGDDAVITVDLGIFFTELVGGCSCGDDPLEENVYCVVRTTIDCASGEAVFSLVDE